MPKFNEGEVDKLADSITMFRNVEMTADEAIELENWLDAQIQMIEESDPENKVLATLKELTKLINAAGELGNAHTEDTKQEVTIHIAADYEPIEIDAEEDAAEETTDQSPAK